MKESWEINSNNGRQAAFGSSQEEYCHQKILYISWGSLSDNDMIKTMERNALDVTRLDWQFTDYDDDNAFEEKFFEVLRKKENIDFVFSFNFIPLISGLCQRAGIYYISWIYDSPHLTLYSKKVENDRNIIFHFDRKEADSLRYRGCPHAFHLPLGVNADRLGTQLANTGESFSGGSTSDGGLSEEVSLSGSTEGKGVSSGSRIEGKDGRYRADISFLGSLYTEENFFDSISYLPPELYGYLKGLMDAQRKAYKDSIAYFPEDGVNGKKPEGAYVQDIITPCLGRSRMEEIKKYVKFSLGKSYEEEPARIFTDMFLFRKISSMERVEIMQKVFEEFNDVKLYTGSDVRALAGLCSEGRADYEREMPDIFYKSRINLNITLRTIRSGIPLRAMDIMGAGGFLLSNYQPELSEYFTAGEDFDFYKDIPDLIKKCRYYLEHDEERERIAENGMRKVRNEHGLDVKLGKMVGCLKGIL